MDIIILIGLSLVSLVLLGISYWKNAPYLGVASAIIVVLLGTGLVTDALNGIGITKTFCAITTADSIVCNNITLPIPMNDKIVEGFGIIYIMAGLGMLLDSVIAWGDMRG